MKSRDETEGAMRTAIYCRVSTDGQERDGTSLETQAEECLRYARVWGWEVVAVERDGASGAELERPGLDRVRALVRGRRVDVVLAHALDRLSRSQNHVGILDDECGRHGARLEFVTERFEDTPVGRFVRAARAFTDELEREKIRERTIRGKAKRAREGRLAQGNGRGIYGYTYAARGMGGDGRRRVHPEQAAVVRRIFAAFVAGDSCHRIAARLTADGVETLQGWARGEDGELRRIAWHPLSVRRILTNEAYAGRTVYRRTRVEVTVDPATGRKRRRVVEQDPDARIEVPDATPAIIERELWERAQAILADPTGRARTGRAIYPYPLSGHVRCDACRTALAGSALSGGPGRARIRYYGCRNRNLADRSARCRSRYVRAAELEGRLVAALRRALADPAAIVSAYNHLRTARGQGDEGRSEEARRRVEKAEGQLRRLARAVRLAEDDAVAEAVAAEMKAAARAKKAAEAELARREGERAAMGTIDADPAELAALSERVAAWLDPEDLEKMELVLKGLEITVWAGTEGPRATGSLPIHATRQENVHADIRPVVSKVGGHPFRFSFALPQDSGPIAEVRASGWAERRPKWSRLVGHRRVYRADQGSVGFPLQYRDAH
jgi:site-specific DNA recombinase